MFYAECLLIVIALDYLLLNLQSQILVYYLLAIDQASIDLVYAQPNNQDLVERIESRHGLHQLTAMRNLKMGNPQYELISIN